MLVESSIAATFCGMFWSYCQIVHYSRYLVHKLHSKQEDVFFHAWNAVITTRLLYPFICLFFLLNFVFAFKISGNSNLSPHSLHIQLPSPLCQACLPHERLFQGETDGSSFPNGGLRVTHSAAAFTTWDRASPPFVMDKCHLEIWESMGRPWKPRKLCN